MDFVEFLKVKRPSKDLRTKLKAMIIRKKKEKNVSDVIDKFQS